mmetsp:Transcript_6753/g.921  ORF Transcript_6753/g.921 Transcript_6753/m.921 type:complete len:82 (+) Transcript_6753:354-599(+)
MMVSYNTGYIKNLKPRTTKPKFAEIGNNKGSVSTVKNADMLTEKKNSVTNKAYLSFIRPENANYSTKTGTAHTGSDATLSM